MIMVAGANNVESFRNMFPTFDYFCVSVREN